MHSESQILVKRVFDQRTKLISPVKTHHGKWQPNLQISGFDIMENVNQFHGLRPQQNPRALLRTKGVVLVFHQYNSFVTETNITWVQKRSMKLALINSAVKKMDFPFLIQQCKKKKKNAAESVIVSQTTSHNISSSTTSYTTVTWKIWRIYFILSMKSTKILLKHFFLLFCSKRYELSTCATQKNTFLIPSTDDYGIRFTVFYKGLWNKANSLLHIS